MKFSSLLFTTTVIACGFQSTASAITFSSNFGADYTVNLLGSIAGLPTNYGGLTFIDSDTLLIGGAANTANGLLYEVETFRDQSNHITSFGTPTAFGSVGEFNDGGVAFGPDGVLFTTRYPTGQLGQTRLGSVDEDRIDNVAVLGIGGTVRGNSIAAVNFVPTGFAGADSMKISTWRPGAWFDVELAPDGNGTFDLVSVAQVDLDPTVSGVQGLPGGPEGFVYIDNANPGFSADSLLVAEWSAGNIAAYEIDGNGDPILSTRRVFLSDLIGAEGAAIDPLTGDFFFSTFGGENQIVQVSGFVTPPPSPPTVPEPMGMVGYLVAGAVVANTQLKKRQQDSKKDSEHLVA